MQKITLCLLPIHYQFDANGIRVVSKDIFLNPFVISFSDKKHVWYNFKHFF